MKTGSHISENELFELLEERADFYNTVSFIETDPISVPHRFSHRDDIEIAAFLTAVISWGQRPVLIRNALHLMKMMDEAPAQFIRSFQPKDLKPFSTFVHRTFNGHDCLFFMNSLQRLLKEHKTLESVFCLELIEQDPDKQVFYSLNQFRQRFLGKMAEAHAAVHISNPAANSAAKRLNMFLRWMVRKDTRGVDFGIWNQIQMKNLMIPLDIHSGNSARKLGLLTRNQNDWKSVLELTRNLRRFDSNDPVKYDYALFGMGVNADTKIR